MTTAAKSFYEVLGVQKTADDRSIKKAYFALVRQFPPETHGRIINAQLKSDAIEISATDWMAAPALEPKLGNMSAIFVQGSDYAELRRVFDKLGVGAERTRFQDLHEMPFGIYGQFYDRYGVQWIFRGDSRKQ